jgi:hypothetical protein
MKAAMPAPVLWTGVQRVRFHKNANIVQNRPWFVFLWRTKRLLPPRIFWVVTQFMQTSSSQTSPVVKERCVKNIFEHQV